MKVSDILFSRKNVYVPVIVTVLLIASSFVPLIQVVLVEVAKLYEPLSSAFNVKLMPFYFVINSLISAILLFLFYKSKNMAGIIFTNLLAIIFLYPTLIYFVNFILEGTEPPYMLPLSIAALVYGGIFLEVAALKIKYRTS